MMQEPRPVPTVAAESVLGSEKGFSCDLFAVCLRLRFRHAVSSGKKVSNPRCLQVVVVFRWEKAL